MLQKLMLYGRWVLLGAGLLTTVFSEAYPDIARELARPLFWGGLVVFVLMVLWFLADLVDAAWENIRIKPKAHLSKDEYTYITEAMRYVAFQSREFDHMLADDRLVGHDGSTGKIELAALAEIEQQARDGNLVVRGKRKVGLMQGHFDSTAGKIPPDFWEGHYISNGAFLAKGNGAVQTETKGHGGFPADLPFTEGPPYTDLEVDTKQLRALFPEKGWALKLWEALARPVIAMRPDQWKAIDSIPIRIGHGPLSPLRRWLFSKRIYSNDPEDTLRRTP